MFKIKNHLSPQPMQNLFTEKFYQHDLRKKRSWETYNLRTVWYGTETIWICNMGPKTWDLLPNDIKESNSLLEFKQKIKIWRTTECTCRLCKTYIHGLGFINSIWNKFLTIFSFLYYNILLYLFYKKYTVFFLIFL